MFFFASALPLPAFAQSSAAPAKADAVEYHATIDNAKYVFGVAPPVAHVKAGNILEANSLDCFGNALQKPGDSMSLVKGDNPLTGPFYIDGAEPGGTLDAPEVSAGNTLYLPVNVPGALFYFGDGHAAMGDGEVAGSAVEVPMRARLQFELVKGKSTGWPRFENEKEIMAAGVYRPVDDALRIAVTELIHWIHSDYGLSELDAYELLSKVAKVHLTEMVDPNYVVIASIEKKYLPPKKGFAPR